MKFPISLLLFLFISCGESKNNERCRSAEEAQMKCQIDYAEKYELYQIPDWVKDQCLRNYPEPGCYFSGQ